jgi:alkyl sulfatase BDS1-like metallo-beta-lactamase superfamily hydrolase
VTVPPIDLGEGMATALSIEQLLDTLCIRLDGLRAASEAFVIDWNFTDTGTTVRLTLSNGALTHVENPASVATPDLALTLTKVQLLGLLAGRCLAGIDHTGDPATMDRLLGLLDNPDPGFAIITP